MFAFLLVNLLTTPAAALDPSALPIGAWFDVVECLESGDRCEPAASNVGDAAWARFLRGSNASDLQVDDRFVLLALRCASDDGGACADLAGMVEATDTPASRLRATLLRGQACGLGHAASCVAIGRPAARGEDPAQLLSETGGFGSATSTPRAAASSKELASLTRAADGKKAGAVEHLALAAAAWRALGDPDAPAAVADALRPLCDKAPGSTSCALVEDLDGDTAVFDARLEASATWTGWLCRDDDLAAACKVHAGLLELGRARPWGDLTSRQHLRLACDQGDDGACEDLTAAYRGPVGRVADLTCERVISNQPGDARACAEVRVMRWFGVGLSQDKALADQRREDACIHGDGLACIEIADDVWDADVSAAWAWYDRACQAGAPVGCSAAGRMMLYGEGVPEDAAGAVPRLRKAVAGHVHNAMLHLGNATWEGQGGLRADRSEARNLYFRGCAMGDKWSCGSFALLNLFGFDTTLDATSATALAQFACERGDESTCAGFAELYGGEDPVLGDDPGRLRWGLRRACDLEDQASCDTLDTLEVVDEVTPTTAPLPRARPPSSWSAPYRSTAVDAPADDGPRPRSRPGGGRRPSVGLARAPGLTLSAGSARSWTEERQAALLRLGATIPVGPLALGADLDWVSDNRWRPKVARDYWRVHGWINLRVNIGLGRGFALGLGGGGGVGGYRDGPGTSNPVLLAYGAQEFLTVSWSAREVSFGLRLEQQQLFGPSPGPALDHVTQIAGFVGVRFD